MLRRGLRLRNGRRSSGKIPPRKRDGDDGRVGHGGRVPTRRYVCNTNILVSLSVVGLVSFCIARRNGPLIAVRR